MIRGKEFQSIIYKIFKDVKNYLEGEQIQVNCPRCQERSGTGKPDGKFNLEINTAKRVFHCWKCDEPKFKGSLGKLIRIYGSNSDYEIYKDYAGQFFNYSIEEDDTALEYVELPKEIIYFSEMDESNPEHLSAYSYMLLDRKIKKELLIRYRIGFCTEGKYAGRIIIPSFDLNGDINYFVARAYRKNLKPTYLNPKVDKDKIIFNEGMVNWDSTIYLVEGAFEMLSLVNATPQLGKNISKKMFFKLKEKKPNIIVALDPDAKRNAIMMTQQLEAIYVGHEDKIKFVDIGGKYDIDEIRKNIGKQEIINKLYNARKLKKEDYFLFKKEFSNGKRRRY